MSKHKTTTNHSFKSGSKEFMLAGDVVLPILEFGRAACVGWDIPVCWAFDASGQAWEDNAHGGYLRPVTIETLKGTLSTHQESWRRVVGHLADHDLKKLFGTQQYYIDYGDAARGPRFGSFFDVVEQLPEKMRTVESRREVALMQPGDYIEFPTHTIFRVGRRVNIR